MIICMKIQQIMLLLTIKSVIDILYLHSLDRNVCKIYVLLYNTYYSYVDSCETS